MTASTGENLGFRARSRRNAAAPLFGVLLLTATSVWAQQTITGQCMDDRTPSNLGCTANDIKISAVQGLVIDDDGCAFPGDTVDFTATFAVELSATDRYDIGLYFAADGDNNNDGALTGTCSVSTLPTTGSNNGKPFVDLDGGGDTCGDIHRPQNNPLYPRISLTDVACVDDDGNGKLDLPNCVSWRQSGANEFCNDPSDAYPGSPSKCRCDQAFNVPIDVPAATFEVTKTAVPDSLPESSGSFRFDVTVRNTGADPNNSTTLSSLTDDIYGDITTIGHDGITSTDCELVTIAPNTTYECSFNATFAGNAGDSETDTVTATGTDDHGNVVTGSDDATVELTDVLPSITVAKSANPTSLAEPGGNVTFQVVVTNTSPADSDAVTITSLTDDIHGDLESVGTCPSLPHTLVKGATINCTFTAAVTGNSGYSETDIVTAAGTDDEGNPVSDSDDATVTISNTPSQIEVTKTASPTSRSEPGGSFSYLVTVKNNSTVDAVTISSLSDDKFGILDGQGTCDVTPPWVIAPGDSRSCSFSRAITGNANTSHTNTVTASGTDDDGQPVTDDEGETVNFTNVPPDASLTKAVTSVVATFEVTVSNESNAEALNLTVLSDDKFGNIATSGHDGIVSTTCTVPQALQPKGQLGDSYSCSFDATVTTSPHTDTVTGTVNDDDGSTADEPSDSATITFE